MSTQDKNGIDESGFGSSSNERKPNNTNSSTATDLARTKLGKFKVPLIIGGLIILAGGGTMLATTSELDPSSTSDVPTDRIVLSAMQPVGPKFMKIEPEVQPIKPPIENDNKASDLTVSTGGGKVEINGHNDLIASLLLQSYPTREELRNEINRVQGAEVSKEELDVFLLTVKNNADNIRLLKNKPVNTQSSQEIRQLNKLVASIQQSLSELKKITLEQNSEIKSLTKTVTDLDKNSGWHHNRLSKLEGNPVNSNVTKAVTKVQVAPARRLVVQNEPLWTIQGASGELAFIKNSQSGQNLRVTQGFEVPGCGPVTDINASLPRVTTTNCVISNI